MSTALGRHEFAYRALRGQAGAFDYLGKKLATGAKGSLADLEDGLRLLRSDLPFIELITENQIRLNELGEAISVSPDLIHAKRAIYDEILGGIALYCALLRFGFRHWKQTHSGVELEQLVQEYRNLHVRCRPELSEAEIDALWNDEWVPLSLRKRMPWGLSFFLCSIKTAFGIKPLQPALRSSASSSRCSCCRLVIGMPWLVFSAVR